MKFIIGFLTVAGCVLGGYVLHHGKLSVIWQPVEILIIGGAAVGAFSIANPGDVIKDVLKQLKTLLKGPPYSKDDYLDLLKMMFEVFKLIRMKGMLEIESHIENPKDSEIFNRYPKFLSNHHAVDFFCDYLRIVSMGVDNFYQVEDIMLMELEIHHHENEMVSGAVATMADGLPALGIVAAVLGVIITMGSITEPPEILGGLIGAALVGTFLGVLVSYGFVGPMAQSIAKYLHAESHYMLCMKTGILSNMQGHAPAIIVEFARKAIAPHQQPSFAELDQALNAE